MSNTTYPGEELELFADARNWKAYWAAQIRPHLGANVLEVGAGIGSNTELLRGGTSGRWVCLEPDPVLAEQIPDYASSAVRGRTVEVAVGTIRDLPGHERFDTVLYIDVLEHIEHDAEELAAAAGRIVPGGTLIVLAPSLPVLFSPFDRAVGHYRRYTRASLRRIAPAGAALLRMAFLDSAGVAASLANRVLLRRSLPTRRQIWLWDRMLIPVSRVADPLSGYRAGKSILAVWRIGSAGN